jgi:hypothetical protein
MILLTDLEAYTATLKDRIDGINYLETVLHDTQINRRLKDITDSENTLLFLLIPGAAGAGSKQLNLSGATTLELYLINKTDYKEGTDDYIQIFRDLQPLAIKLSQMVFNDATVECHPIVKHIDFSKYGIYPAAGIAGCNGWMLTFEIGSWL